MSGRDDQLDRDEFSLEAILAEFSGEDEEGRREETPDARVDAPAEPEPEPVPPEEQPPQPPVAEEPPDPAPPREKKRHFFWKKRHKPTREAPAAREEKVLDFPEAERPNPVAEGIGELRRRADEFAGHMYEEEGAERERSVRKAERFIPGVDEETAPPVRERRPRRVYPPDPDIAPGELAKRYSKGLRGARIRCNLVLFLFFVLLYLTLARTPRSYLPPQLLQSQAAMCYLMAGIQALALLLGVDGVLKAVTNPFRGRMGMDLMVLLANLAVLADALLLPTLPGGGIGRRPFCAAAALELWCVLYGNLEERRGRRFACRTAASASEPYLVTRDEGKWNGRDTYSKWSGPVSGFGSQIQGDNGAQRIFRRVVPVLFAAAVLFALIASVGRKRPQDFVWSLAAILTAAAPLSATLCYGLPWHRLSRRLSKSGAALAGWQGVTNTTGGSNLLLTDIDLFPVGAVSLNGVKVFGDVSVEKVVAVTATVIRDSGCGLSKIFYDLLRGQGGLYRRGENFTVYEGGGVSEIIRDELVLVGSASFMGLMDVALPPGLKVKNAVFCAINGDLAGIFALKYNLPGTVPLAIDSLIRNKVTPVLATRDFNLIPATLRQRFKLPAEKMEFPPVERRRELSDPEQEHSDTLTAVLCREGVGPYAEAVVGGRRLRTAVRLAAVLACLGCAVGAGLSFYLTFVAAYESLTPVNLLVFLLMWLVPTPLIAGWVDRY